MRRGDLAEQLIAARAKDDDAGRFAGGTPFGYKASNSTAPKSPINIGELTTGKQWQDDVFKRTFGETDTKSVEVPEEFKDTKHLTTVLKDIASKQDTAGYNRTLKNALNAFDRAGFTVDDLSKLAKSADDSDIADLAAMARKYKMSIGTNAERQQIIDEGIEKAKYGFLTDLVTAVPGAGILGKVASKVPVLRGLAGTPGAVVGTYAKPVVETAAKPLKWIVRPAPQYPVRNTILSSPEEIAAAEARRRSLFP